MRVWQLSRDLVMSIYEMSKSFPADERFGMTSQIKRAVISITNNIAEGSKRKNKADFAHFLNIAEGSAAEIESMLTMIEDLGYATPETIAPLIAQIGSIERMLRSYQESLNREF